MQAQGQRVEREGGATVVGRVRRAFELAFGRKPSEPETELGGRFLEDQGLFALCRSLFNANEFVYVD